jgi:hypothetical protein
MLLDSPSFEAHEYLRDTLSLTYKECKSCTTRTELTCIKCGLCWCCHWLLLYLRNSLIIRQQLLLLSKKEIISRLGDSLK